MSDDRLTQGDQGDLGDLSSLPEPKLVAMTNDASHQCWLACSVLTAERSLATDSLVSRYPGHGDRDQIACRERAEVPQVHLLHLRRNRNPAEEPRTTTEAPSVTRLVTEFARMRTRGGAG